MSDEYFSAAQLAQLALVVKEAIREEFADAGLRLDDQTQQDEAREDFRFVRKLRKSWDGTVMKVGNSVLIAVIAVAGVIFSLGFWAWISGGGK
jgi:hypothetical protein